MRPPGSSVHRKAQGILDLDAGLPTEPGGLAAGISPLGLGRARDGLVQCSARLDPAIPAALVVMLHGAGGMSAQALPLLAGWESMPQLVVLAPDSRGLTWDVIRGGYGPDVVFLQEALAFVLKRQAVDPAHVAIGGFSDGASYALSLGLTNGRFFSHVVAFSPGFMAPSRRIGAPAIFISHGRSDAVLPIGNCSRRLVPALREASYAVEYREFDGAHAVPPAIARAALAWFQADP